MSSFPTRYGANVKIHILKPINHTLNSFFVLLCKGCLLTCIQIRIHCIISLAAGAWLSLTFAMQFRLIFASRFSKVSLALTTYCPPFLFLKVFHGEPVWCSSLKIRLARATSQFKSPPSHRAYWVTLILYQPYCHILFRKLK